MSGGDLYRNLFARLAHPVLVQYADDLVAAGTHAWVPDPHIPDVAGLCTVEQDGPAWEPHRAVVVLYVAEDDFECNDDFVDAAYREAEAEGRKP